MSSSPDFVRRKKGRIIECTHCPLPWQKLTEGSAAFQIRQAQTTALEPIFALRNYEKPDAGFRQDESGSRRCCPRQRKTNGQANMVPFKAVARKTASGLERIGVSNFRIAIVALLKVSPIQPAGLPHPADVWRKWHVLRGSVGMHFHTPSPFPKSQVINLRFQKRKIIPKTDPGCTPRAGVFILANYFSKLN